MSNNDRRKSEVKNPQPDEKPGASLDEHLQAHIGVQLKSMYDSYLSEPIPDRLVDLLQQLDAISKKDGSASGESGSGEGTGG